MTPRVGLHLPHFGPLARREVLTRVIDLAEALGFDTIWVGDHVAIPVTIGSRYPYHPSGRASFDASAPFHDPFVLLSYAAGRTQRVRLGFSVLVVPYRHPLVTAKMVATLDALSAGRVTVGVGVGWLAEEFTAVGADYPRRGRDTDAALDLMRRAWASSPVVVEGIAGATAPLRVQPGGPPLLGGGHGRAAMRRALRIGDGWQATAGSADELAALLADLADLAGGALPGGFEVSSRLHLSRFSPDGRDGLTPADVRALVGDYARAGAQAVLVDLWDRDADRYLARLEALAGWLGLHDGRATALQEVHR